MKTTYETIEAFAEAARAAGLLVLADDDGDAENGPKAPSALVAYEIDETAEDRIRNVRGWCAFEKDPDDPSEPLGVIYDSFEEMMLDSEEDDDPFGPYDGDEDANRDDEDTIFISEPF